MVHRVAETQAAGSKVDGDKNSVLLLQQQQRPMKAANFGARGQRYPWVLLFLRLSVLLKLLPGAVVAVLRSVGRCYMCNSTMTKDRGLLSFFEVEQPSAKYVRCDFILYDGALSGEE